MALNIKDLQIHSPAFTSLEHIPKQYTSDGENISPPLGWSGLPAGTQQLALICHDPDAPLPQQGCFIRSLRDFVKSMSQKFA
ncbi:MAG: hypothetical protein V7K14_22525 [Nostoc sp.]|uniref:YbhB/YbcL family Raf kinase inhibitor-like protein n=1 Tax=Nostoc sp. TaxID=1180 RepID=UPI002FFA3368